MNAPVALLCDIAAAATGVLAAVGIWTGLYASIVL